MSELQTNDLVDELNEASGDYSLWDKKLGFRTVQEIEQAALRLNSYRQWLVDRAQWLQRERMNGGNWEYLKNKEEETRYCLEKFDALTALDVSKENK